MPVVLQPGGREEPRVIRRPFPELSTIWSGAAAPHLSTEVGKSTLATPCEWRALEARAGREVQIELSRERFEERLWVLDERRVTHAVPPSPRELTVEQRESAAIIERPCRDEAVARVRVRVASVPAGSP